SGLPDEDWLDERGLSRADRSGIQRRHEGADDLRPVERRVWRTGRFGRKDFHQFEGTEQADFNCGLTVAAGHTSVEGCLHAYAGVATCILAVSVRSARLGRVERIGLVSADQAADSRSVVRTAAIPAGKRATDRGSNHVARFC